MEKNIHKFELTKEMRKRLLEEQKKAKMSNNQVAAMLGISETTYKNIIRSSGGNKFIKEQTIIELAQHYGCSSDYLKCLSNNPHTDKNGHSLISAINFEMRDKITEDLFNFFKENPETCNNIHYLFCEFSDTYKKEIISTFNSISRFLRCCFLFSCPADITDKNFNLFLNDMSFYDPNYVASARSLMVANYLYENKNYQSALPEYVNIVYKTITLRSSQTSSIAKEACIKIYELKKNWNEFPSELYPFSDELSNIEKHSFVERNFQNETKQKVKSYLNKYFNNIYT